MKTLLANYVEFGLAVCVAGAGGLIRVLTQKGKMHFYEVLAEILVAGFAGILVNALLMEFNVNSNLKIVLVAISGYTSREVITLIKQSSLAAIRIFLKQHVPVEKQAEEESKEEKK